MLITLVTILPAIGALLVALYPAQKERESLWIALGTALVTFALSLGFLFRPHWRASLPEPATWIPSIEITYQVGMDGISLWLYLLTTFLMPLAILSADRHIKTRRELFFAMTLLLETAMLGAFVAADLFLFYICWELMLVPMYFIIGIWGGPRRIYATFKFFIFTMIGSLPLLLAIIYVYHVTDGPLTWVTLQNLRLHPGVQVYLFLAFALSFAIKVPMFPFHTWLPDAHVEAPTAGSIILAGILLKMGGYGFIRFGLVMFPDAAVQCQPFLIGLCVIGIIYGALVAMVQEDIKSLVAYSSVSHMGVAMLGIFTLNEAGVLGGIYLMLAHGITTGALFLLVGMLYDRRHTRLISDYGGIAKTMPWYAAAFLAITLASIGLPGTAGFVAELLVLWGTFLWKPWVAVFAGLSLILGAWYMLRMYRYVFYGPLTSDENRRLKDLAPQEVIACLPLIFMAVLLGVIPGWFLAKARPDVAALVQRVESVRQVSMKESERPSPSIAGTGGIAAAQPVGRSLDRGTPNARGELGLAPATKNSVDSASTITLPPSGPPRY